MLAIGTRITFTKDLFCSDDTLQYAREGERGIMTGEGIAKSLRFEPQFAVSEDEVVERKITMEEYLELNKDVAMVVHRDGPGKFYIHPLNKSGMTVNFIADGNRLTTTAECK